MGTLRKKSNCQLDDKTANAGSGNFTKYWKALAPGMNGQAWCNCFVNYIFTIAYGLATAKKMLCTSGDWSYYTPTSASYFKNKKRWFTSPQVGDVIYFKNSTRIHHVGLVTKVGGGVVYTIEGNTSSGNNCVVPNGGGVFAKSYQLTNCNIAGYGRPLYDVAENKIVEIPITPYRSGLKVVGTSSLNIRKTPVDGNVVGCYKSGDLVMCTAKFMASDGKYWFKTPKGWCCSHYFEGWLKESNGRWWYIQKGYTYPKSTVKVIDGGTYAFDKNGWMIEASDINNDGCVKEI